MSSKRIVKRTDGSRLPTRSSHVTTETDEESVTASEMEDDMEIYHPVVTKKKKLMNLTHNLQTDHPRSNRAVTISVAKDDDSEFLVVRESQGRKIISEHRKPKMQLTGEPSGKRSAGRETSVFMPEITKQEKPTLPETWGREDETPTQPSESSETLYTYTSDSVEHLTPSDIKVTSSEGINITPMEEYVMVIERIIKKGSLSPRSTEVLRKNIDRCKSILKKTKADKTPVLDSSIETPRDTPFPPSRKGVPRLNEIFSIESDYDLPTERAASIIPLESQDSMKKSTPTKPLKKREQLEIPSTSRYQPSISSKESISDASSASIAKEEDTEAGRYEVHSSAKRTFKELLKDSCNLDNFTIEDPFSDFSLHNLRQDKLLKERIVRSQRDDDSFLSADSGPCSDRKDSSTSTSDYYDSISCSEDLYQQPHPASSTQNNADLHSTRDVEKKRGAFRKVTLKMESIKEESTSESTDDEISTHRKFAIKEYKTDTDRAMKRTASSEMSFFTDDKDSFTESEYIRNLIEEYQVTEDAEESVEGLPLDKDEAMNAQDTAATVSDSTIAAGYSATVEEINDYAINSQLEVDLKDKVTCAAESAEIMQDVTDDTVIVDTDVSQQLEQTSKFDKRNLKGMKKTADEKTDISKRKKCAKCGMPVVKGKEDTSTKRLVRREENIVNGTSKTEIDRSATRKKTASTCKCGCVKTTTKNDNLGGGSHRGIMSRISNYFFPLLADFLVPRHLVILITDMTL